MKNSRFDLPKIPKSFPAIAAIIGVALVYSSFSNDLVRAQEAGDKFMFEDVPASIGAFTNFSFTLKALNDAGETDVNYIGTVKFSSDTDAGAELPEDFTFTEEDAGVHEFTDALYFTEAGIQVLKVVDASNEELKGEIEIEVKSVSSGNGLSKLEIDSPTSGTVNTNIIDFAGSTVPGIEVRILDNGQILGSTDADAQGEFNFQSPPLPDGDHVFVVETDNAQSDAINVTINTDAAALSSVDVDPLRVNASGTTTVTVTLKSAVERLSVVIDGIKSDLEKTDTEGKAFSGEVSVPSDPGKYGINIEMIDVNGDMIGIEEAAEVTVLDPFSLGSSDGADSNNAITFFVPSQVQNVNARSGDKEVLLSWSAAADNSGIAAYEIRYGISPDNLSQVVRTNDANTEWIVKNLQNGRQVFFQVFGVDDEGNRSDQGSEIVSAVPGMAGSGQSFYVDQIAATGPAESVMIAAMIAALGSGIMIRFRKA